MLASGCVRAQRKLREGNKGSMFMQCVPWSCIDPVSQSNLFKCKSCLVWLARSGVILCTAFKQKNCIERKKVFFHSNLDSPVSPQLALLLLLCCPKLGSLCFQPHSALLHSKRMVGGGAAAMSFSIGRVTKNMRKQLKKYA